MICNECSYVNDDSEVRMWKDKEYVMCRKCGFKIAKSNRERQISMVRWI